MVIPLFHQASNPPEGLSARCGSANYGWVAKELPTERSSLHLALARKTATRGEKCAAMTSLVDGT
jgi:hypothetical protein